MAKTGRERVVVIGAGVGGLTAALDLAVRGLEVTVLEMANGPGGKLRAVEIDGQPLDAGPTVFTMREVFDALFADAGASLSDYLKLTPLSVLARHCWDDGSRLDLFADVNRSADAIGDFAGRDAAQGYLAFSARSQKIFETLDASFMRAQRPNPITLSMAVMPQGLSRLWGITPFSTLWQTLQRYFPDPRLRQLFARYATYCGSSPFDAPATLMLVAHAEQRGVWSIDGGMFQLAKALAALARRHGVDIRYDTPVTEILTTHGRVSGVRLPDGTCINADIVISNADASALADGVFGPAAMKAAAKTKPEARSLSAITWLMRAKTSGFPLDRHNVFFSQDYPAEFADIAAGEHPRDPTVYICAQDRNDDRPRDTERLLCLINAPAFGDRRNFSQAEIERCSANLFQKLSRCGLAIDTTAHSARITTPVEFHRLYPATGGALYGRASHGWRASFQRPAARTTLPGLYLAGGSIHPGPGVPMAAISGRLAAQSVMAHLASTSPSRTTAMRGGMSMQSATTARAD